MRDMVTDNVAVPALVVAPDTTAPSQPPIATPLLSSTPFIVETDPLAPAPDKDAVVVNDLLVFADVLYPETPAMPMSCVPLCSPLTDTLRLVVPNSADILTEVAPM